MNLIERRDYGVEGKDQLEKDFDELPNKLKKQVKQQSKNRRSFMLNIKKIAAEIFASEEKEAVSPPGWKKTVEKMKKHKNITNPWALSWFMHGSKPGDSWGKGGKLHKKPKPHYKEDKKSDDEMQEKIAQVIADVVIDQFEPIQISESTKKYSTIDTVKTDDGYITIKTNYDEKDGEPLLEEYIVDKNGKIDKYDTREAFIDRLASEGLLVDF